MQEQTQRRKMRGLEIRPFGDCCIEQALPRKYIEATRELEPDSKRRTEALVVSGGVLYTEPEENAQ